MFGHGPYYFSTIERMVTYFGTLFNDLYITRTDAEGDVTQLIKVPLVYAAKDKMLAKLMEDPDIDKQSAITLPRMSFEFMDLIYDNSRMLPSIQKTARIDNTNANKLRRQYTPVPYNFDFSLYIYVKNSSDGRKIVEQILPFFTPEWTATVNLIPEMGETKDIPIVLINVGFTDQSDGSFTDRRAIIWTLSFTVKGYLYGPVVSKPIIKLANTQFFVPSTDTEFTAAIGQTNFIERITVTPGLTANGTPTTNAALSSASNLIDADDNYGFVVKREKS